jgi:hypothetical protein
MDISEYVSECIEIGNNSLNFCLKYPDELEAVSGTTESSLGLFTRHTQSFFEPFLEVIYDDVIRDDRNSFALKKANRLYLYVNVNGHPTNLDQLPVCTITCDGSPITPAVTQQSTGVYYVTVGSNVNYTTLKKYYDTWSGLIVNGQALPNVKMNFVPKEPSEYYHIGSEMLHTQRYGLSLSGIKQEEKITQGEIRRINTLVRKPYTVNNYDVIDGLQYRVYVKVGPTQLTIIDWSDVSQANLTNFFMLDTSWMIPNKYYVDIKVKQNGETLLYNDQLVFNIVSRKMM